MKKIKLIFAVLLSLVGVLSFAGCSKDNNSDKVKELEETISSLEKEKDDLTKENKKLKDEKTESETRYSEVFAEYEEYKKMFYEIKVVDIDGEVLGDTMVYVPTYETLWDALDASFDVVASNSEYGHFITSINGSVVDANYYVGIYENGVAAEVGVDSLKGEGKDVFEFRVESWKLTDKYELLVDKALYHYMKGKMKENINNTKTYLSSTFWDVTTALYMSDAGYDSNLFIGVVLGDELKASIENANVADLINATPEYPTAQNFAKYYYFARLTNYNEAEFKTALANYLDTVTEYVNFSQYTLPLLTSIAHKLNLDDCIDAAVKNPTFRSDLSFGPDGLAWQLTGMAPFVDISNELSAFTAESLDNAFAKDVSLSAVLLPFAAANLDARTLKFGDVDVLQYLFDNFYDEEALKFDIEKQDTDTSSNQIYAALMAYKIRRDKGIAVNIFA